MAEQLALDFPCQTAFGEEDYFLSEANRFATELISGWKNWPNKRLLLEGPRGAGKTHLSRIWCVQTNARFLDVVDVEGITPELAEMPAVIFRIN